MGLYLLQSILSQTCTSQFLVGRCLHLHFVRDLDCLLGFDWYCQNTDSYHRWNDNFERFQTLGDWRSFFWWTVSSRNLKSADGFLIFHFKVSKLNVEGCALERQPMDLTFELSHASCGAFNIPLTVNATSQESQKLSITLKFHQLRLAHSKTRIFEM